MRRRGILLRKIIDRLVQMVSLLAAVIGIVVLAWILYTVVKTGFKSLSLTLLLQPTKPFGIPDGGIANAILGTFIITLGAGIIGVPAGLLGGIYLAEFGGANRLGRWIRFSANVMMGLPSIIVGLFVYTLLVLPTGHFSGFSGSVALAVIIFPVVLRTAEDILSMVPNALREAALAMGMPRWKTTLAIVFKAARSGLITGVLLAVARVSGETAPLLFTALLSDSWPTGYFTQPTANLTVMINEYATNSPFPSMQARAWSAALLITVAVLALNIICRTVFKEGKHEN